MPVLADMHWVNVDVYTVAKRNRLKLTLRARKEAKILHRGMWRADNRAAITHPNKVLQISMSYMLLYGLLDNVVLSASFIHNIDVILAASPLHDTLEDVKKNPIMMEYIRTCLRKKFPSEKISAEDDNESVIMRYLGLSFPEAVISLVVILTKSDEITVMEYCQHIGNNIGAVIIKLADRLHNLRNMIRRLESGKFFTGERLRRQINETKECILKLSYWVAMYEEKFPTENRDKYLAIIAGMTVELKKTVHLAEVALAELIV